MLDEILGSRQEWWLMDQEDRSLEQPELLGRDPREELAIAELY